MIRWTLSEQQADQVLNALAQRPFVEVNQLINALMQQAQQQVQEQAMQAQTSARLVPQEELDRIPPAAPIPNGLDTAAAP